MRPRLLPLLLILLAAPAAAQECLPLGQVGCWYAPPAVKAAKRGPLLIYHRGFHPKLGRVVKPERRLESARQAFSRFKLGETAAAAGVALLVTADSPQAVSGEDLAALERASGLALGAISLAAHSGGYEGLAGTILTVPAPDRLIMLDNFYFGQELAAKLGAAAARARVCAGFYTTWKRKGEESNADRLKRLQPRFPPSCFFQNQDGKGHDEGVTACLEPYLAGEPCR